MTKHKTGLCFARVSKLYNVITYSGVNRVSAIPCHRHCCHWTRSPTAPYYL